MYAIQEAAETMGVSYGTIYTICRELNLGGNGKNRRLSTVDMETIREQMYLKRRRRSKTFRLEEKIESLETEIARLDFELESAAMDRKSLRDMVETIAQIVLLNEEGQDA